MEALDWSITMNTREQVSLAQAATPSAAPRQSMSGFLWPMTITSPAFSNSWRSALENSRAFTRDCMVSSCRRPP